MTFKKVCFSTKKFLQVLIPAFLLIGNALVYSSDDWDRLNNNRNNDRSSGLTPDQATKEGNPAAQEIPHGRYVGNRPADAAPQAKHDSADATAKWASADGSGKGIGHGPMASSRGDGEVLIGRASAFKPALLEQVKQNLSPAEKQVFQEKVEKNESFVLIKKGNSVELSEGTKTGIQAQAYAQLKSVSPEKAQQYLASVTGTKPSPAVSVSPAVQSVSKDGSGEGLATGPVAPAWGGGDIVLGRAETFKPAVLDKLRNNLGPDEKLAFDKKVKDNGSFSLIVKTDGVEMSHVTKSSIKTEAIAMAKAEAAKVAQAAAPAVGAAAPAANLPVPPANAPAAGAAAPPANLPVPPVAAAAAQPAAAARAAGAPQAADASLPTFKMPAAKATDSENYIHENFKDLSPNEQTQVIGALKNVVANGKSDSVKAEATHLLSNINDTRILYNKVSGKVDVHHDVDLKINESDFKKLGITESTFSDKLTVSQKSALKEIINKSTLDSTDKSVLLSNIDIGILVSKNSYVSEFVSVTVGQAKVDSTEAVAQAKPADTTPAATEAKSGETAQPGSSMAQIPFDKLPTTVQEVVRNALSSDGALKNVTVTKNDEAGSYRVTWKISEMDPAVKGAYIKGWSGVLANNPQDETAKSVVSALINNTGMLTQDIKEGSNGDGFKFVALQNKSESPQNGAVPENAVAQNNKQPAAGGTQVVSAQEAKGIARQALEKLAPELAKGNPAHMDKEAMKQVLTENQSPIETALKSSPGSLKNFKEAMKEGNYQRAGLALNMGLTGRAFQYANVVEQRVAGNVGRSGSPANRQAVPSRQNPDNARMAVASRIPQLAAAGKFLEKFSATSNLGEKRVLLRQAQLVLNAALTVNSSSFDKSFADSRLKAIANALPLQASATPQNLQASYNSLNNIYQDLQRYRPAALAQR